MRNLLAHLALLLGLVSAAQADTIVLSDHDSEGLVRAIERANHSRQPLRIELAEHGLYVLKDCAEPNLRLGLPAVRRALTIVGHGAEIRRYADAGFTLLGVEPGGRLALQDLTLAEGAGAIVNRGVLHLDGVRLTDASGSDAVLRNYGVVRGADVEIAYNALLGVTRDTGVVLNYGRIELARSRIAANRIGGRDGAVAASALLNLGEARLTDVGIEGNSALDALPGARALINLGNGRLDGERVVLRDNWPDNWPQETPLARIAGTPAP